MKKQDILMIVIPLIVGIAMISPMWDLIKESRLDENKCLEEEMFYYRIEGSFIFTSKINTTKENADGVDYKCIRWEEKPSMGAALVGQKLIYEKGNIIKYDVNLGDSEVKE